MSKSTVALTQKTIYHYYSHYYFYYFLVVVRGMYVILMLHSNPTLIDGITCLIL